MAKEHGEEYHVDHIIPLSIGGAHHQDNMRVITAKENLEKNAKYIPKLGGVWADNKLALKNRKKYEAL
jgi:5-methylcytosine-specific restriction endonuclease McrA